jgi:hypothetical protein
MNAWVDFAKEMGGAAEDFVKRFGEEQQKNYEKWTATIQDGTKTHPSLDDVKEMGERFQQWTDLAQKIGERIKDSFMNGTDMQKEFLAACSRATQKGSSPGDVAKGFSDLAQKFWTELANNLSQKSLSSLGPDFDPDEFIKNQEQTIEDLSETFKKLSPPFVELFGQALNSSLDVQKLLSENYWTGLRLLTNVGDQTTSFFQKVYKTASPWGQAP